MEPGDTAMTGTKSRVVITEDREDIGAAVAEALSKIDLAAIVRGKRVGVKPNDTWADQGDTTAVTQPDTLRAVLRAVKSAGAGRIFVSGGAGAAETEDVFRVAGLMDVVDEEGVEFFDHNRPPFEEVTLDYRASPEVRGPQRSIMVNPMILSYQALVVVSQLKMHETATVTLALKNVAMSFPAADWYGHPRGSYRRPHKFFEDMHSYIAAMAKRFPASLAVTVGHPAMAGTGPIGGLVRETGIVVASTDPVAADTVGARLLGLDPQGVRHIWEAGLLGLGETDTDAMEFPALSLDKAYELFTERMYGVRMRLDHP